MGESPRQSLETGTLYLVRRIPKCTWNENKKEDYLSRGILSILVFCSFNCERLRRWVVAIYRESLLLHMFHRNEDRVVPIRSDRIWPLWIMHSWNNFIPIWSFMQFQSFLIQLQIWRLNRETVSWKPKLWVSRSNREPLAFTFKRTCHGHVLWPVNILSSRRVFNVFSSP